jgi:hypothetical protein
MKRNIILLLLVLLGLQACNLPSSNQPNTEINPETAVAQTLTQFAFDQPRTATFTPLPPVTFTVTLTSTPAATNTPAYPYVTLSEGTNCRTGPGKNYELIDTFVPGQTIEVLGKDPLGEYWFVRSPNNSSVLCWMWGNFATGGNLANVPFFTPPPSPTPAPNFELTYASTDTCTGWWFDFTIKNTGPFSFKSMSISVRDTVTDVLLTDFGDGFEDLGGCAASGVVSSIDPGNTYTVSSPQFVVDPTGHKIKAALTLCTGLGQGGQCVTKNIEFKP